MSTNRRQFLYSALGVAAAVHGISVCSAASFFDLTQLDFHYHSGLQRQFDLTQLDFHYHSGLQRQEGLSLDEWIDMAVAAGRRCFLLVDHLELYRPEGYENWSTSVRGRRGKAHKNPHYLPGPNGQRQFLKEVARVKKRRDLLIFSGWEVKEGEIDTGLEWGALQMVEAIGWHIHRHDGHQLVRRIRTILEVQKKLQVPMILYHPFSKSDPKEGSPAPESVADLRCLNSEVQKEMIDLLGGTSLYLEINTYSCALKWKNPRDRAALIEDIQPLAEAGLSFTVASDAHRPEDVASEYRPDLFCQAFGIRPEQVNRIVGELLVQRAITDMRR